MMRKDNRNQPASEARNVVMVTYPNAHILDVAGPLEVLTGATLFLPEGISPYTIHLVAHSRGNVSTTSGLNLQAGQSFATAKRDIADIDTLIISGGHGTAEAMQDKALMDYVGHAAARAKRVVSICTGAMILAELGLLDGRRATTHWWWCPILGQRYPDVTIEPDAIFIRDGNIWTSAGVTAGMDLALALLEEDWGHDVALKVARYNVMYMMRPGGQTQFSANLIAQKAEDPRIGETLDHILANSVDDLTVASLASRAAMSERSFTRKFKEETGMTPAHYVEAARLQKARVELEQTDIPVEQIARQTGFGTAERMRRVFQRHLGISATDYRDRFRITIARTQEEHAP
jgi:transcriptional regulator GlxA family with amidase domain